MKAKIVGLFLLISFLLASCNSNSDKANKFIGTWKSVGSNEGDTYSVTKSGENFIWEVFRHNGSSRGKNTASYNKEQDKLVVGGGILELIYDNTSNHLIGGGAELEKIQ